MQESQCKSDRRRKQEVMRLVCKIRRLKNKLYSYGLSQREAIEATLYQFLKAPQVDWSSPRNTAVFYEIQEQFQTDSNTAELLLAISSIIPNWEAASIVEYLHGTLTYNSLAFGIDLDVSEDSSNEDATDMTLLLLKAKKKNKHFAFKPNKRSYHHGSCKANSRFYSHDSDKGSCSSGEEYSKKRVHFCEEFDENTVGQQKDATEQKQQIADSFIEPKEHSPSNSNTQKSSNRRYLFDSSRHSLTPHRKKDIEEKHTFEDSSVSDYKREHPTEREYLEEEDSEKKVKIQREPYI